MPQTKEEVKLQALLAKRLESDRTAKTLVNELRTRRAAGFSDELRGKIAKVLISSFDKTPKTPGETYLLDLASMTLSQFSKQTPEQAEATLVALQTQPETKTVDKVKPLSVTRQLEIDAETHNVARQKQQKRERESLRDTTTGERPVVDKEVVYKPTVVIPQHMLDAAMRVQKAGAPPPPPKATPTPKSKITTKIVQKVVSVAKKVQKLAPKVPKVSVPKVLKRNRKGRGR